MLLKAGSDIRATDSKGRTCCHYAAMNDDKKMIDLIFTYNNKNIRD